MEILKILLFLAFLLIYATILQFFDRKLYARLQNRIGPPWYQPVADFFKLIGKQTLIPSGANKTMFRVIPLFALAAVATAFMMLPVWGNAALVSFEGDVIVVLYLMAIPSLAMFLAGWYSRSLYATIGASRVVTQIFAYEAPLFLCALAPTLISGTWSISSNLQFYSQRPLLALINLPAAVAMLVTVQCKLERTPFDAPEAETEIVSGPMVEYGGRYLAIFKLSKDCELVTLSSVFAAIFLPFTSGVKWADFILYIAKTLAVLVALCLARAATARLRTEQIVSLCYRVLLPVGILQLVINLVVRGFVI